MFSKITLTLGYILTAVSMLVFFICKAYLLHDITIIWCILGWIIGFTMICRSEDAREDFADYLWYVGYTSANSSTYISNSSSRNLSRNSSSNNNPYNNTSSHNASSGSRSNAYYRARDQLHATQAEICDLEKKGGTRSQLDDAYYRMENIENKMKHL